MNRKYIKWIVAGVVVLGFVSVAAYQFSGGQDYSKDIGSVRKQFNAGKGKARLLILVSPTCGLCLHGASEIQKVLDRLPGKDVAVYSVWVPVLASDGEFAVGRATKNLTDQRVTHYWDADAVFVKSFAPVLGLGNNPAWDVYLLYDQNAEWNDTPPKPEFWQEQLGISDETQLDADKLTAEIERLLKTDGK